MSAFPQHLGLSPEVVKSLSQNFHFGSATSSYQIEGAANEDGRGPSIWDTFSHTPGCTTNGETGDVACDHYHRWEQDLNLMADLGLDAYRFSIAWPRVQPKGYGDWNPKGLDFYDRLVDGLLERGIRPHATLYHWDLPQALQDLGGWASRDTAFRFAHYADAIGRRLGDRLASLATHNEPWCTSILGNAIGKFAPGFRDEALAVQVSHHLLLSHGLALQALRASGVRAPLGIVLNQSPTSAATDSAADRERAQREYARFVRWYMDPLFFGQYPVEAAFDTSPKIEPGDMSVICTPMDFLGINYYTRIWCSTQQPPVPAPRLHGESDMGWEIYPEGLRDLLVGLHAAYRLPPIYITECGIALPDRLENDAVQDPVRIQWLQSHLAALAQARDAGVDVRGFFYWSLLDNYEWDSGYAKRFGIVHVDYETQTRTPKASALWYRDAIAALRNLRSVQAEELAHG
jgi:beta-glucosidase